MPAGLCGAYVFRFLFLSVLLISLTVYWGDYSNESPSACSLENLESFHPTTARWIPKWSTENTTAEKLEAIAPHVCPSLLPILERILNTREINQKETPSVSNIQIQVVGGGTVGLSHALQAYESGASVALIEKRTNYTRDIWFDLYGDPWFSTLRKLSDWSATTNFSSLHAIIHGERAISVRSQILERYLSQVLFFLGVDLYYGYTFSEVVEVDFGRSATRVTRTEGGESFLLPFDILLGADGSKSRVREYLGVNFLPIESIQVDFAATGPAQVSIPPELNQVALVLRLKPNANGECPKEAISIQTGEPELPWEVSFKMPGKGVHQVFKRFFANYCELQIFFGAAQAKNQVELASDGLYDWDFILEVVNNCLEKPFGNVDEFLSSLKQRSSRETRTREYDVDLVTVAIRQASNNVIIKNSSIVLLIGDASVTSHFRLGIGINSAFDQLTNFETLLKDLATGTSVELAAQEYGRETTRIQTSLAVFEVMSILYEAYCDYLIFIDPNENENILNAMMVFGKDYILQDYNQEPWNNEQLFANCPTLQHLHPLPSHE